MVSQRRGSKGSALLPTASQDTAATQSIVLVRLVMADIIILPTPVYRHASDSKKLASLVVNTRERVLVRPVKAVLAGCKPLLV